MKFSIRIILTLYFVTLQNIFAGLTDAGSERISIDSLKKHLMILSDDSLKGRGTGSEGSLSAAKYIAGKLAEYNLKPVGSDNSFFQQIQFRGVTVKPESKFSIVNPGASEEFKLEKDFLVYSSAVDPYFPTQLPMVFAGYGIIAPEYDYNDYQSVNVEDKIVILLLGEPNSDDPDYFEGTNATLFSSIETKQRIALSHGAKGIIFIPDPQDTEDKKWDYYTRQYSFEEVYLAYSRSEIFSILLNPAKAEKLFGGSSVSYMDILDMEKANSMKSFQLANSVLFDIKVNTRNFISPNVVALKEGSVPGLKNSYIILSAHYDHLGIGKPVKGDSIFNGFIDNASGVSALLEFSRCLSQVETKRSIIFIFTTAEEKGLLGSSYYCDHPVFPLYKTIANVNIDGLAFLNDFNSVIPVGGEFSTLNEMLNPVLNSLSISKSDVYDVVNRQESFTNSDQFSFAKAGIPSLLITEDIETEAASLKMINWMENFYHSPFDDKNQFINYDAMQKHLEIIFSFCTFLANNEEEPEWKEATSFISIQLRNRAEKK